MPFGLRHIRRYVRSKRDPNSTCVDSAIELVTLKDDDDRDIRTTCSLIRDDLEHIQAFLKFAQNRDDDDDHDHDEQQDGLVSSIEDAFASVDHDIGSAVRKGDLQRLRLVYHKLSKKILLFRARISEAYANTYSSNGLFTPGSGAYVRIERKYMYSTCVDSTIYTITRRYKLNYLRMGPWSVLERDLKLIQIFLTFVPIWSDADKFVGEHLGDLVGRIEDAFKTVEVDIESAIEKADDEGLDVLCSNLFREISILNLRITEVYVSLDKDKLFQNSEPLAIVITELHLWNQFCTILIDSSWYINVFDGYKTLHEEFIEITRVVQHFGNAYINYSSGWDGTQIWELGSLMDGSAIYLARIMFLFKVGNINKEDATIAISDLRLRIRKIFPKILDIYMQPPRDIKQEDVKQLVDIILPRKNRSLQTLRDGLHPVIEYLLDSYSTQQAVDIKLIRLDIENIVRDDILGTYDIDQLVRKIELIKREVELRILINRSDSIAMGSSALESINMGLSSVQYCFGNLDSVSEKSVPILRRMLQLAGKVASLEVGTEKWCDALKFKLFIEFKFMKVQLFLMEQCNPNFVLDLKDKICALNEGLEILFKYLSYLPTENQGYVELILTCFERIAKEKPPPYFLPRSNQVSQYFINHMSMFISTFLKEVNHMNSDIQGIVLQCRSSLVQNLPKTNEGLGFVDISMEKLMGLKIHRADLIGDTMKHQIEAFFSELESFKSFLVVKEVGQKSHQKSDLHRRVIMVAREADYLIDRILLVEFDMKNMLWLSVVINEMKELNCMLAKFVQIKNDSNEVQVSVQQTITTQASSALEVGQVVISLEDQEEIIIDQLITRGTSQKRNVVTISGMPGIGKTTLAKKVYGHPRVKTHFQKLAWCCVSQVYRKRELLLKILSDIHISSNDELDKKSDDDLLDMLYKSLKGVRYCVVMDDVWSSQVWEELGIAFPDDNHGSRIVITTRNQEVGLKAQPNSTPHILRLLTKDESWKLLQEKVFHTNVCPQELQEVGLMIAEGCKGLPLSLIAIAGILKTTEMNVYCWKQIEGDLNSRIFDNPEIQCMHILELSYNHLPDDLKPCFLYFAAFGEDGEVSVKKLVRFWIAEGFVREVPDQKTLLEDVAQVYVMNLIARSLLMIVKRGSDGRVKACKVHDMLYKVCLRKVEEDNFLQYVNGYDQFFPSAGRQLDYGVDSDFSPISVTYNQHRLSLRSKRKHFVMLKPSGPSVRTLIFNPTSDSFPRCAYDDVGWFITDNFKILSILDIESINLGSSFPKRMELLYPLRYLGICGDIKSVPSTIAKLWNLETLVVKGLMGMVTLPATLWSMSKLRHLHVTTQAIFSFIDGSHDKSTPELRNMVSLSCPALFHGDNSEEMMKLFPELRKLRCTFSEPAQHSEKSIRFPTLDFLVELESLKIVYYGHLHQYCQLKGVKFSLNLKKLSLSDFSFTWDDFSTIGKLPNLNILKLVSIDFESSSWEMADDEFRRLEYLKLDSLKIAEWNVESDPVPNIKQLVLRNCIRLKEVPESFGGIATLEMIELRWCSESIEASVMTILEQKLEYGDEGFKAFINGFVADPKFSVDDD